jgi:hypothetical protein
MSTPAVLFLAVMIGLVIFLFVSTTNIVKEEPAPRSRRRVPKSALRPRAGEPTADRLERAAQYTGDRERPFSWMHPGTITGKLTMLSWLSRWWMSGSYMRRRLIVSVLSTALLLVGAALVLVWLS